MRIATLPASPVIIPISDLRQDKAGVVRLAGASGERRLAAEERAAMRPASTPTLEQFLVSEGLDYLVPKPVAAARFGVDDNAVVDEPSVWYRNATGD